MQHQAAFILGGAARLAMAVIFAQSAWHALHDVGAHGGRVAGYRLLPHWAVMPAAWALPVLSAAAAAMLLVPAAAFAGAALGLALMAVFTGAIAVNLRRGRVHIECGCGGAQGQRISAALVARNLILLAALVLAGWAPARGAIDGVALLGMAGSGAAMAALYFTASQLLANRAAFSAAGIAA
jgi:hypothetical protein